jgi:hypothetical protein
MHDFERNEKKEPAIYMYVLLDFVKFSKIINANLF